MAQEILDLSADYMQLLRCHICAEVPLGNVIRCPNWHIACEACQQNSQRDTTCAICLAPMLSMKGCWIRCRALEAILDLQRFWCPFWRKGCCEILWRWNVQHHKDNCHFNGTSGSQIQICKYFKKGNTKGRCQFWTSTKGPYSALHHLQTHYDQFSYFKAGEKVLPRLCIRRNMDQGFVDSVYIQKKKFEFFMVTIWTEGKEDKISFSCLQMDESQTDAKAMELVFPAKDPEKTPDMKLTLPIVSVLDAPTVLENRPVSVPRSLLLEHCMLQVRDKYDEPSVRAFLNFSIDFL